MLTERDILESGVNNPVLLKKSTGTDIISFEEAQEAIFKRWVFETRDHKRIGSFRLRVYRLRPDTITRWTAVSDGFILNASMPGFPHARPSSGQGCRCEDCRPDSRAREITV